jgi:hypothetical protein
MCWTRWRKKRRAAARLAFLSFSLYGAAVIGSIAASGHTLFNGTSLASAPAPSIQILPRRPAREIPVPKDTPDEAVLGRPLALALDGDRLYIADALDCAVKIFSTQGRYLESVGRKGQGPGELSFPSGVCVSGGTIAVADKLNSRIQIFNREGKAAGGFKLPFAPDRILALDGERFLVTSNPTGRRAGERLLHIYDREGGIVWEGLEARTSSDPIKDAFANMILVCGGTGGDFYVIFRSGERTIRRYEALGDLAGAIDVDPSYAFRNVETPDAGRGRLKLAGFCWAAAFDGDLFYLSPPEIVDGKDLGPGRTVALIDPRGRLRSIVELPCAVHRFLVAGDRIFAIDDEGNLRIFEVGR